MKMREIMQLVEDRHPAVIGSVLAALERYVLADRILIFGSLSKGQKLPSDVDAFIDLSEYPIEEALDKASPLLKLARHYYGSFDPFVLVTIGPRKVLFCRDDHAHSWIPAKNAMELLSAARGGKPLSEIVQSPIMESDEFDDVAWAKKNIIRNPGYGRIHEWIKKVMVRRPKLDAALRAEAEEEGFDYEEENRIDEDDMAVRGSLTKSGNVYLVDAFEATHGTLWDHTDGTGIVGEFYITSNGVIHALFYKTNRAASRAALGKWAERWKMTIVDRK